MTLTKTCPFCERDCGHRDNLRAHIHERHLKSAVIDAYLAELDADEPVHSDRPLVRRTNPRAR